VGDAGFAGAFGWMSFQSVSSYCAAAQGFSVWVQRIWIAK